MRGGECVPAGQKGHAMLNEVQAVQAGLNYARQVEGMRKVMKLFAQRLEDDAWGIQIEGFNRQGAALSVRIRIESTGSMFLV